MWKCTELTLRNSKRCCSFQLSQFSSLWNGNINTHIYRPFSTTNAKQININDEKISQHSQQQEKLTQHRQLIYELSLSNVHSMGWTDKAIVHAVNEANLPLTLSGLMFDSSSKSSISSGSDNTSLDVALVHRFMEQCNLKLRQILRDNSFANGMDKNGEDIEYKQSISDIPERLNSSIRTRLEMLAPYIRSKRWHEAMAIGSLPQNTLQTAHHLEDLVDIILSDLSESFGEDTIQKFCYGFLHKTAIGGVYVATELHMLADESTDFADTWAFLQNRIFELQSIAEIVNSSENNGQLGINGTVLAMSAVMGSMGSAVLSLGQPLAKGVVSVAASGLLPTIMTFMQPQQGPMHGSSPSDYESKSSFNSEIGRTSRSFSTSNGQSISDIVRSSIDENNVRILNMI